MSIRRGFSILYRNHIKEGMPQLFEPFLQDICVFLGRYNCVIFSDDMHDRNSRINDRLKIINRIIPVSHGFLFILESILLDNSFPLALGSFPCSFSSRPAFKIADWSIVINTSHRFGVSFCPAIDIKPSTAHSFENNLLIKSMLLR